jgi:hypothetical protein
VPAQSQTGLSRGAIGFSPKKNVPAQSQTDLSSGAIGFSPLRSVFHLSASETGDVKNERRPVKAGEKGAAQTGPLDGKTDHLSFIHSFIRSFIHSFYLSIEER